MAAAFYAVNWLLQIRQLKSFFSDRFAIHRYLLQCAGNHFEIDRQALVDLNEINIQYILIADIGGAG